MRMKIVCALALGMCGLLFTSLSEAHHVGGHGLGGSSSFNPYTGQSRRPSTFVDYSFNIDRLEGGLGYVLTNQFSGEYSPFSRLSLALRVPILSIREDFLPETDGIGDLVFGLKGLLGIWDEERRFLSIGTDVSFPTGDRDKGTGEGDVLFSPYLTISQRWPFLTAIATAGSTVAADSVARPSANYAVSIIVPIVKGAFPIDGLLTFQGSTFVASDTFTDGSTKAYLLPAIGVHLSPKLLATLGGRVSVLDTLAIKPGIALARSSTAPLSDIEAGFAFNLNYSF